jgi:hypothetical protein
LNWDDTLPTELLEKWQQLYMQLGSVGQSEIDRLVLLKGAYQSTYTFINLQMLQTGHTEQVLT